MKHLKLLAFLFIATLTFTACSGDETLPEEEHEEEMITTMNISFTTEGGADPIVFSFKDLDGEGGADPVISNNTLVSNTTYTGVITLLNESENPAEDITEEVKEEAEDHQFFYTSSSTLSSTFKYAGENDKNGNPVGIQFTVATGASGSGTFTIILRHEPSKSIQSVKEGNITDAGGETDIEVSFPVTIE